MRLWHEELISKLPRQQLLGQHREVAALRGNGWGKKHFTVDYVFKYSPYKLYQFHLLVMNEMISRGYRLMIIGLIRIIEEYIVSHIINWKKYPIHVPYILNIMMHI